MNPKFIPLTRHEMFFGITPNTNLSTGGTLNSTWLTSKVASTPVNQTYISPTPNISINTEVIAQQQAAFIFSDFLWKYRWPIGIGAVLIIGGIAMYQSQKQKKEEEKNNNTNPVQTENDNYSFIKAQRVFWE